MLIIACTDLFLKLESVKSAMPQTRNIFASDLCAKSNDNAIFRFVSHLFLFILSACRDQNWYKQVFHFSV